jgi:hypothetical protein
LLPISERDTRKKRRKSESVRIKLPASYQSKNWPKCPICSAPYKNKCINCGYLNDSAIREALFDKASEVKGNHKDKNEDQYEGNE